MSRRWLRRVAALVATAAAAAIGVAPTATAIAPPRLSVRAAALIEESTGQKLYARAASARLAIASTTKLMTALLTLEHIKRLGTIFTQGSYRPAPAESQIGLVPGERMSVHDLMLALMLPSANDAAEDLAVNIGHGSVARFVSMMNIRARQLHLSHTHYATPVGLDTSGNYSSASDLVTLASYLREHFRFFVQITALPRAVLHTGRHPRLITNRNDLVVHYHWINGVKTGHTLDAGYVMVGSGTRGRMTLISAVLGTRSESERDSNTLALLRYGFANFHLLTPVLAGSVLARPLIHDQPGKSTRAIAAATFTRVFPRSLHVRLRIVAPRELVGPLPRHAVIGRVVVLAGRRPVARIPLLLAQALPAPTPASLGARFGTSTFTLVLLALLALVALGGAVGFWFRRNRSAVTAGSKPR